jgi:hypothetical protein
MGAVKLVNITILVAVFTFCGIASAYAQEQIPDDLMITLERTMCFGWCPAYSLTIKADRTVKFSPDGQFAQRGDGPMPSLPLTGKITAQQLGILLSEIKKINFFSLQRHYGREGKSKRSSNCPKYWTDSPSATITIIAKGKRKTVGHYLGCKGAKVLDDLEKFEHKIDEIANADRWTSVFGWGSASVVELSLSSYEIANVSPDRQIRVKTVAVDPENDVLTYNYSVSAGKILGSGANVIWDLTGVLSGTYTITAGVDDGCGLCGRTQTRTVVIKQVGIEVDPVVKT